MFFKKKLFSVGLHDIGEEELKHWSVLNISNDDLGTLIIQIRKSKPPIPDIALYSTCIEIKWDYSGISTSFPTDYSTECLRDFESALEELFWYNNLSFFVKSIVGLGEKRWLIYTKSFDEFIGLFNKKTKPLKKLPIEISYYDDPNWEIWSEDLEKLVK